MSAFWGYVWLAICIMFAIGHWIFNVTVLDNALPPVLDSITTTFTHSFMDNTDNAVLFMRLMDYAPLFEILLGIIGFIVECTIFGTSVEDSQ